MDVLFEAVGRQKKGFAFCDSLDKWLADIEEKLGLRYERERILAERKLQGQDIEWEKSYF